MCRTLGASVGLDAAVDEAVMELQILAADVLKPPLTQLLENEPRIDDDDSERPNMTVSSTRVKEKRRAKHSASTAVSVKDYEVTRLGKASPGLLTEAKPVSASPNHPLYCLC